MLDGSQKLCYLIVKEPQLPCHLIAPLDLQDSQTVADQVPFSRTQTLPANLGSIAPLESTLVRIKVFEL